MRRRTLLEFAVLGFLHEAPQHGYELRRRLNDTVGAFRALSFGTLYPCLARLLESGLIAQVDSPEPSPGKRPRITYGLTESGRATFADLAASTDPAAWSDEEFTPRLTFFGLTQPAARIQILIGRRDLLANRLARTAPSPTKARGSDVWSLALARHGREATSQELRWVTDLLEAERSRPAASPGSLADPGHPAFNPAAPAVDRSSPAADAAAGGASPTAAPAPTIPSLTQPKENPS